MKRAAAGALTGLANGLFGAGGGMVAVSALTGLCKMPEKEAHASAICVILPLSLVSGAVYALKQSVDWNALIFAAPALTLGSFLGARLLGKLKAKWVNIAFSVLMLITGVWMVI